MALGLCGALGCKSESQSLSAPDTGCYVPCQDDPSKTCKVPCPAGAGGPGIGQGAGAGGAGGAGSTGGAAGSVESVDVSGSVVQIVSVTFDASAPYLDPVSVVAPGPGGTEVEVDSVAGSFTLTGAAPGLQWVLAKELDGVGGAFSLYTIQDLGSQTPLGLPIVSVELLSTIGTQIDVPSLVSGAAHLVMEIGDDSGQPLEGAEIALPGADIGYAVGPGQYSASVGSTGTPGLATALNIPVAAKSDVAVTVTVAAAPFNGQTYPVVVRLAPDTATYARVSLAP